MVKLKKIKMENFIWNKINNHFKLLIIALVIFSCCKPTNNKKSEDNKSDKATNIADLVAPDTSSISLPSMTWEKSTITLYELKNYSEREVSQTFKLQIINSGIDTAVLLPRRNNTNRFSSNFFIVVNNFKTNKLDTINLGTIEEKAIFIYPKSSKYINLFIPFPEFKKEQLDNFILNASYISNAGNLFYVKKDQIFENSELVVKPYIINDMCVLKSSNYTISIIKK